MDRRRRGRRRRRRRVKTLNRGYYSKERRALPQRGLQTFVVSFTKFPFCNEVINKTQI